MMQTDPTSAVARARSDGAPRRIIPSHATTLSPKQRLLLEYLVHGCSKPHVSLHIFRPDRDTGAPVPVQPGTPLTLPEACELIGLKRRYARALMAEPIFAKAMAAEVQQLRSGAAARAVNRMVALIDEPGQGKAADRKVQLAAAQAVLGETSAGAANVHVNVGVQVTPGYVIRLPAREGKVVEHE